MRGMEGIEPEPTLIFETIHGSRAYGLDRPQSDVDIKGIVVGPSRWYHGFCGGPEQIDIHADHVHYEIRKFFRLAAAANPTALELLFTEPSDHLACTSAGVRLLENARAFLSRRVRETFSGYALSQLRRIKRHRSWLLHPPNHKPVRADFGLPEQTLVSQDQLGAAAALMQQGALREAEITPNFLQVMQRERAYRTAKRHWDQYQQWLRHRNPARAELEARHGYDTKHALHLVRLLRMGIEILSEAKVRVRRSDRDELIAIRDGAWSYDALLAAAESLGEAVGRAAASSPLPEAPDESALDALCVSIVEEALR